MTPDEAKVLPCPFCGSHRVELVWGGIASSYVICRTCRAQGPKFGGPEDAESAWDIRLRTTDPATQRVLKALEAIEPMEHCDCEPGEECPWCRLWLAVEALAAREGK